MCPVAIAGGLDNIFRRLIQNPKKILGDYIHEGMTVLDIGCGPGFFSIEIAKMLGKSGKVIAADLQEGMLEIVKNKIRGKEIEKRIRLHKCEKDRIGISEKVDLALALYVIHEVPDQKKFLEEIKSILKPKAKLFIIELKFHVSKKDFEETIKEAAAIGLKPINKPKVFFSRTMILEK